MSGQVEVKIEGLSGVSSMLQIADVTLKEDWELLWRGLIRSTQVPGGTQEIVKARMTLEGSTQEAFDNSGRNIYSDEWTAYPNEPRYEAMKRRVTGSTSVLVWVGAKDPLRNAFLRGHRDHVETVQGGRFQWGVRGVKGAIAARLAQGGFWQPWDKTTSTPKREAIRLTEATAIHACKGMQRILLARLGSAAYRAARAQAPRQ